MRLSHTDTYYNKTCCTIGVYMPKRAFFKTFASFLLVIIAIIVPFGIGISFIIGRKMGIISDFRGLGGIFGGISGIFSEKRSDNAHLSQNVVVFRCIKPIQLKLIPKQLQQLTPKSLLKLQPILLQQFTRILLTKPNPNIQ